MKNWEKDWPNKTSWTHAQVARLRELRDKGTSFDRIAHEVGHTAYACQSKATQIGVRAPRITAAQKCIPTVQKPNVRHHQHWTKEEEQQLLALDARRLSCAEIGAKLNRSAASVELRLRLLFCGAAGAKKSEGSRRPCLCCKRLFNSQGPHHRLCNECRQIDPGVEPARIVLR